MLLIHYEQVRSFAAAKKFQLPRKVSVHNTPRAEFWTYIKRSFIDLEESDCLKKNYIVDSVVRSNKGLYLFKYFALDDGQVPNGAEDMYSSCHEMVDKLSWTLWNEDRK
jgi:hypothetical protein